MDKRQIETMRIGAPPEVDECLDEIERLTAELKQADRDHQRLQELNDIKGSWDKTCRKAYDDYVKGEEEIRWLQSKLNELENAWGDDLIESYDIYVKTEKELESLRVVNAALVAEQKLLGFAVKHYPTMWLASYPKLKDSVAQRMQEEDHA